MDGYQFIDKKWILSPVAKLVYQTAALVSLSLYATLAAAILGEPVPYLRALVLVGISATALNGVAMECFLFRFDTSSGLMQIFWFCVMICAPLGPALYCFFVYSRSDALKASCGESVNLG